MRRLWMVAGFFLSAVTVVHAESASEATPVTLVVGQHEILRIPKVRTVRSGNSALIEAHLIGPGEVMVAGLAPGDATLVVDRPGEPQTLFAVSVVERASASSDRPLDRIQLGVGHQTTLRVSGVKRIAVGDPKIADVHIVSPNELLLTGVAEGRTTLLLWQGNDEHAGYLVEVGKPRQESLSEIKQLLGPMEGITLRIVGERIILDGVFDSKEDMDRAEHVCRLYEKVLYCMPHPG